MTGDQVCAKGDEADLKSGRVPDTCSGDSGGGLVSTRYDGNYVLLGVVSFGESQCGLSDGRPGVYTNVQSHVSWIRRVIGEETRVGRAVPRCTTVDGRRCILPFRYKVYFSDKSQHLIAHVVKQIHWCI